MCDSYDWMEEDRKNRKAYLSSLNFIKYCENLVWKVAGKSLTFYKNYGETRCNGCTPWCLKHCYMNIKEFLQNDRDKLGRILPVYGSLKNYSFGSFSYYTSEDMPFYNDLVNAMYVTYFGSGTINDDNNVQFVKNTIESYPNKHHRIFTRDLKFVENFYGSTIIFSADCSTPSELIDKALKNKNINIAVLGHPDNAEIISELKEKIKTVIYCDDCMESGCVHLCFHETNRYLLIQNYEEVEN